MKKRVIIAGIAISSGLIIGLQLKPQSSLAPGLNPTPLSISPPSEARPSSQSTTTYSTASADRSAPSPALMATQPIPKPTEIVASDGTYYPVRIYQPLTLPNDPAANQWWITSTDLPGAWERGYGSYQTTVAIIDTGFALNHEELSDRWVINSGEQGVISSEAASQLNCTDRGLNLSASCNLIDDNYDRIVDNEVGLAAAENPSRLNCTTRNLSLNKSCNLIDDDNNGYTDDFRGWDFANYDANVQAGETNPGGSSTAHGTMTAGVLGATGNNGKGIAGVNWSTKILPLQALDDDGYGDTLTVSRAILYAVDRHVDIISISLGADAEDPYLRQTIDYALSQDVMVVVASGNNGCDCISYPARYPEVLAVGASDQSGAPTSFSNFGASLDILAPGQGITTASWSATHPTNTYASGVAGTSFATPYVAGLLAQLKSLSPNASYADLVAALNETSDQGGLSQLAPWSPLRGYGVTHAGRSSARLLTATSPTTRYQFGPMENSSILDASQVYDCQGARPSVVLYELRKGSSRLYTTNELTRYINSLSGWTSNFVGYQCVGQTVDHPATIRSINLPRELGNMEAKN